MDASAAAPYTRLADYFVIIGYDDAKERNGVSVGRILQRFPEVDWPDVPFFQGLELFCQPQGWKLHHKMSPPTYFVSVLTDIGADRHFVACLSLLESRFLSPGSAAGSEDTTEDDDVIDLTPTRPDEADRYPACPVRSSSLPVMYSPKCLVIVSRHEYFEVFRNCLGTIYSVYVDKLSYDIETLVSNLLSGVMVPPPGGPQIKFSLGANDRQAIQPPLCGKVPMTKQSIAVLFQELGISNVICLFCAVLTDRKILFLSQSYTRLTDACHALCSLIYPLKYSYIYIPLLPGSLIEVLHSPTPFIMGLNYTFKQQLVDLADIVYVDVDSGSVFVPDSIAVPSLPEAYHLRLLTSLTLVLNREVFTADYAFHSGGSRNIPLHILDKQIRACFLRLFADLFMEYRSCLRVVRIFPKPYITFHKSAFLGLRGFQEDEFMNRLLDSMSFHTFISERGIPLRVCDIFDELCSLFERTLRDESDNNEKMMDNIVVLAQKLQENECPNDHPFLNNVPQPSEASINNSVPHSFPVLDSAKVNDLIDENVMKHPAALNVPAGNGSSAVQQLCEVSVPPKSTTPLKLQYSGNIRRLDVLKLCLRFIFENKISDARKMLSAVLLSMKSPVVRVVFCQELYSCLRLMNRATLEAQQFDLVVRLMNCALQNDSASDEYGIAYAMLTLATAYCRRLSTGVMQFAYTCVQDHPIWKNQQFWESSFYHDVHCDLRNMYSGKESKRTAPFGSTPAKDVWNLYEEPCVLKITAEKMRSMAWMSDSQMKEVRSQEEATVYSQAIHYANRIVYFLVPMDVNRLRRVNVKSLEESSSASVSNVSSNPSAEESASSTTESDVESGFMEGDHRGVDLGQGTVRFIAKFLDKVCSDAGLGSDRLRQLHMMVPGVVAMQIETLENVHKESKKLPPIHKPRMLVPVLLPGEQMLQGYLRVYLLPDGRLDTPKSMEKTHSNSLLPAEGAIFLTNYRIIFKGQPCDPYICDKVVMRVIPVMAMTKEKRIGHQYLNLIEQGSGGHYLHDVLQIRSATFQLMKIAFDEEVSTDKVQTFCQSLEQLRWPEDVWQIYALSFSSNCSATLVVNHSLLPKDKSGTIKGIAKAAWKKTKKAGFGKEKSKPSKDLPPLNMIKTSIGGSAGAGKRASPGSEEDSSAAPITSFSHERPSVDLSTYQSSKLPLNRTLDRLSERSYCQDFQRLGLCTRVEVALHSGGTLNKQFGRPSSAEGAFRLTVVNRTYAVCRSYPSVLAVPSKFGDESLRKIVKGHKHSRFPVVTWCSDKGALLLRGAGFHVRNVVQRWKQSSYQPSNDGLTQQQQALKSSVEQERYFSCLVSMSPTSVPFDRTSHLSSSMGSLLSLDSLLLANLDTISVGSSTPDVYRKPLLGVGPLQKAVGAMRSSGGIGPGKTMTMRLGFKPAHTKSNSGVHTTSTLGVTPKFPGSAAQKRLSVASVSDSSSYCSQRDTGHAQTLHRASLYIFGEKGQAKVLKLDPKCEFIPIDYPDAHSVKESLKKFLRVTSPSNSSHSDPMYNHLVSLNESGWLQQIKSLLQTGNAIVDVVDLQNSSVAVCLEYGWDATTQIVSLAQLMLDPFYRTVDGFRILVEKEWLSFGHRFSHRCNHTLLSASSGYAPIFIQFLDAVHQIQIQYPSAFEFNDFYLRFLAYHSTAAYFRTFLLDCEAERIESGLLQFDSKPRPRPEMVAAATLDDNPGECSPSMAKRTGASVQQAYSSNSLTNATSSFWEFVAEKHRRSSLFYNFLYSPIHCPKVLRPQCSIAFLDIWDYYLSDPLSSGPAYDLDVAENELLERQADRSMDLFVNDNAVPNGLRRVIDINYDGVDFTQMTGIKRLLDEIHALERDSDLLPQPWDQILSKSLCQSSSLEFGGKNLDDRVEIARSPTAEWSLWLSRTWHKKDTIELLLRGRFLSNRGTSQLNRASQMDTGDQHSFQKYNFTTPEQCHVCNRILWGVMKQGLKCTICDFSCHEKCASVAPGNCSHNRSYLTGGGGGGGASGSHLSGSTGSGMENQRKYDVLNENFDNYISLPVETRTHEGYLMKRGALLKAWKQRWFVLDSIQHQLRYYDAMEDSHCKGYIDLSEVNAIGPVSAPPGSPKAIEGAFFDLRTVRRVYNFMANSQRDAQEWIEKIQACLQ